jgi:hypothetical protein
MDISKEIAQKFLDEFCKISGDLPVLQVTVAGGFVAIKSRDKDGSETTREYRNLEWPK